MPTTCNRTGCDVLVLGIDPGATTGFALLTAPLPMGPARVLWCGTLRHSSKRIEETFDHCDLEAAALREPFRILAVERQWTPDFKSGEVAKVRGKITAAMKVAAIRGGWKTYAEICDWTVDELHPSTWRKTIGAHGLGREACKALAVQTVTARARQLFAMSTPPGRIKDDLAEAILIAEYTIRDLQHKIITKGVSL